MPDNSENRHIQKFVFIPDVIDLSTRIDYHNNVLVYVYAHIRSFADEAYCIEGGKE